jgi:hypothetical protein
MTKNKDQYLSLQHIFDKAAVGMLRQNAQAMGADGESCAYRGTEGCKCAVGFLIKDEHYSEFFEGPTIAQIGSVKCATLISKTNALVTALKSSHVNIEDPEVRYLLESLQEIHDDGHSAQWPEDLHHLAENRGLSTKSMDMVMEERRRG